MTEEQIPKLAGVLVEHQRRFVSLPIEDAQWVIQNAPAAIGLFVEAVRNRSKDSAVPKPDLLLEFLGTVAIPATAEKFVAREKFVVNTNHKAPVKISFIGSNFSEWFLGKTEEPIGKITLRYHKLRRYSVDGPIIAKLGGEAKAETTLTEMFSLTECQKNGEDGVLLNNGYANIFYIRDINVCLRAVGVSWDGGGWDVGAGSVGYPFGWDDGGRVLSRNC